jgi:hypothetical protein
MQLMEQELFTLPGHLRLSGFFVAQSVLCFVDHCLPFSPFSCHGSVCISIYGFWLLLWYIQEEFNPRIDGQRTQWQNAKSYRTNNDLQNTTQKTTIYKTTHRKQRSTKHHTEQIDLQNTTQKTTIYKTPHRKDRSTKHHTENNDLQNTTQKRSIYKTPHRKQRSTKHHTEKIEQHQPQ